jgi:uncharacterized membrane protein
MFSVILIFMFFFLPKPHRTSLSLFGALSKVAARCTLVTNYSFVLALIDFRIRRQERFNFDEESDRREEGRKQL